MKKFLFLASIFLAPSALALDNNTCAPLQQYAVSTEGICQLFSSPCDISKDWTRVRSCEDIPKNLSSKKKTIPLYLRKGGRRRPGSGSWTRPQYKRLGKKRALATQDKRTRTHRNYSSKFRLRIRQQKGGSIYIKNHINTKRPAIRGAARLLDRSGALSNEPKFTARMQEREAQRRNRNKFRTHLTPAQQKIRAQRRKSKIKHRTPSLRRIFKGRRLEGNGNQILK